ncbi:MAG: hypothetical protein U0893_16250 [Chloroflexota bacterium]
MVLMLGRRGFLQGGLAVVGCGLLAGCGLLPAAWSSSRARRVGYLTETVGGMTGRGTLDGPGAANFVAFRTALGNLGYEVGSNLELEQRVADGGGGRQLR